MIYTVCSTDRDGYVNETEEYDSKPEAMVAAKNWGDCYVVKGTQLWNKSLGRVEEHDRYAQYWYVA